MRAPLPRQPQLTQLLAQKPAVIANPTKVDPERQQANFSVRPGALTVCVPAAG